MRLRYEGIVYPDLSQGYLDRDEERCFLSRTVAEAVWESGEKIREV